MEVASVSSSWVLSTSPSIRFAPSRPAMMQAEDEPRPRAIGMALVWTSLRGGMVLPTLSNSPWPSGRPDWSRRGGCGCRPPPRCPDGRSLRRSRYCTRSQPDPAHRSRSRCWHWWPGRKLLSSSQFPLFSRSGVLRQAAEHQLHAAAHGLYLAGCFGRALSSALSTK